MYKSIVIGLLAVAAALAQPPGPPPGRGGFGGRGPAGPAFFGRGGGPGFFGRTVTGAPFSAVEVTTSQQVLGDGNVIQRQTQTTLYRDAQGRTRVETTQKHPDGTTTTHISIHDPVAGVVHELNPDTKVSHDTALRMPPAGRGPGGPRGRGPGNAAPQFAGRRGPNGNAVNDPNVTMETLSAQTINGVSASGTRMTHTIPAGSEGNARAIQIVHETWMSEDLKVPVMTKHSDPRSGTTTTQLTNIVRAEPDSSLFTVPSGYTVQQGPGRPRQQ